MLDYFLYCNSVLQTTIKSVILRAVMFESHMLYLTLKLLILWLLMFEWKVRNDSGNVRDALTDYLLQLFHPYFQCVRCTSCLDT